MIIYFRACEKQETISYVDRYNYTKKSILLRKCWLSLQKSGVSSEDKIIVIYDEVSEETLQFIRDTAKTKDLTFIPVLKHEWAYHLHTVVLINTLREYSIKYPDELHYIVEDDYLHLPTAISCIKADLLEFPYFAVPYDYPDRYTENIPVQIRLGRTRHWRTITSSTMTVLAKGNTWMQVIDALAIAAPTSNDKVFEEIYKQIPCISPIPGLSSHMTRHHQTPLIDWDALYEDLNIEDY